jgi:hypothetical protein
VGLYLLYIGGEKLTADSKFLAAAKTPALNNPAAGFSFHAFTETVTAKVADFFRLAGAFYHMISQ